MDSDAIDRHKQFQYCTNRLQYRASKKLTAVKVYSVASESKYLLVFGVPKINLRAEVKREFEKYGTVVAVMSVTNELSTASCSSNQSSVNNIDTTATTEKPKLIEIFTDCFKVVYENIENARRAKRSCDTKNFYGGILHISYAPEYETIDDLAEKLNQRKREVEFRNNVNKKKWEKQKNGSGVGGKQESLVWQRSDATSSSTSNHTITNPSSSFVHNKSVDGEPSIKRKKLY